MSDSSGSRYTKAVATSQAGIAYSAILDMITEHELAPGSVVSEAELVRQLGVSRTPVREALHRLDAEGHLLMSPGRGYRVAESSEEDLVKVYRVRAVLEGAAAYDASSVITHAEIGRLRDLFESMEKARLEKDDRGLAVLNSEFHRAIGAASRNQYLEAMLDNIHVVFDRFRRTALVQPGRRDAAAAEHGQMIELLEGGKSEEARALAESHVWAAFETRRRAAVGSE